MPIDLHTIASASHLSREDRRAYLEAMEAENRRDAAQYFGQALTKTGRDAGPRVGPFEARATAEAAALASRPNCRSVDTWRGAGAFDIRNTRNPNWKP